MPLQIQANAILGMSLLELQQFIQAESMENPALYVEENSRCPVCGFLVSDASCPVCGAAMSRRAEIDSANTNERDYLERVFAAVDDESEYDPFRAVASGVSLVECLKQQARMSLGGRRLRIAEYLIDCLDDDGYFRESLFDVATRFAVAVPEIEEVLTVIQSFDPAGIGARDLRECLILQLRAHNCDDPASAVAEKLLMECWDDFCRMKHKTMAGKLEVSVEIVQEACAFIRDSLNPYPASAYHAQFDEMSPRDTAAVVPDVLIHRDGDTLKVEIVDNWSKLVGIDQTYDELYKSLKRDGACLSDDDRKHIKEHVERVKCILDAISLRKKTLARLAMCLVDYQKDFINFGPSHLRPLRQKDIAAMLEVHESTVCRALANKYCRLPSGEVISFEVFFDSALPVRETIKRLVAASTKPMSDSEIASKLAEHGFTIARRTVAKYREQLKMLPYQLRAA